MRICKFKYMWVCYESAFEFVTCEVNQGYIMLPKRMNY